MLFDKLFHGGSAMRSGYGFYAPSNWQTYVPVLTLVGGAGNIVPQYATTLARYNLINKKLCLVSVYMSGDGGAEGAGTGALTISLPFSASCLCAVPCGTMVNGLQIVTLKLILQSGSNLATFAFQNSFVTVAQVIGVNQDSATREFSFRFFYETT